MLPVDVTLTAGSVYKEFMFFVSKPGVYAIKCKPPYLMGMVALVQVENGRHFIWRWRF